MRTSSAALLLLTPAFLLASCGGATGRINAGRGDVDAGIEDLGEGNGLLDGSNPDACTATTVMAKVVSRPVDVILIADTSPSMGAAVEAVRRNINVNFTDIIRASGVDYRVILVAGYPELCVDPPLGGAPCAGKPARPANTARFFHYAQALGSSNGLSGPLESYNAPDPNGAAPGGWSDWLRPDAAKVIIQLSDTTSTSDISAADFDARLIAAAPMRFGTAQKRDYVYHGIIGIPPNNPVTKPWMPADPVLRGECRSNSLYGLAQPAYQEVAIRSGGLRFPLCEANHYDVVFQEVAKGVVQSSKVPCTFEKPEPPMGQILDDSTVVVRFEPGGGAPSRVFLQVADAAACKPDAFYFDAASLVLCPAACVEVQRDEAARIDVQYGCYVPLQ